MALVRHSHRSSRARFSLVLVHWPAASFEKRNISGFIRLENEENIISGLLQKYVMLVSSKS